MEQPFELGPDLGDSRDSLIVLLARSRVLGFRAWQNSDIRELYSGSDGRAVSHGYIRAIDSSIGPNEHLTAGAERRHANTGADTHRRSSGGPGPSADHRYHRPAGRYHRSRCDSHAATNSHRDAYFRSSAPNRYRAGDRVCFFDGLVRTTEADEYVQVLNAGLVVVDLAGWRLVDQSGGASEFTFPFYQIEPGASVRVYTNEVHPESGGFSFQRKSSIWNNSDPDEAALIGPNGNTVSTYLYPPSC